MKLYNMLPLAFLILGATQCSRPKPVLHEPLPNETAAAIPAKTASTDFSFGYSAVGFPYLLETHKNETCFNEIYREISPKLLRFPGGTIANFYHPDGPGYGFLQKDIDLIKGRQIDGLMSKQLAKQEKLAPDTENFLHSFIEYIEGSKTAVILVANVYTGTVEECLFMIETFQKAGIEIKGIELGNELYMKAYENRIASGESYWQSIIPFKDAINKKHPEIPTGVVLAPTTWHKETSSSKEAKYGDWNTYLASQKGYDAVITHIYPRVKCKDEDMADNYACAKKKLQRFVKTDLVSIYQIFTDQFPEKSIWITEWNIRNANDAYGNSFLQASFITDFMNRSFDFSQRSGTDMLLTYHNLSGGKGGAGNTMFSEVKKSERNDCAVQRRAAHFMFAQLEDCYDMLDSISTQKREGIREINYYGSAGPQHLIIAGDSLGKVDRTMTNFKRNNCTTLSFENGYSGNGPVTGAENEATQIKREQVNYTFKESGLVPFQILHIKSSK